RRLLVPGEQTRGEAVAPPDLAEEGLAVLGVADGARRHEQGALRAERFELAAVLRESVPNARDREREEPVTRIDALAEPCDDRAPRERVHPPVDDVRDEQPGGV